MRACVREFGKLLNLTGKICDSLAGKFLPLRKMFRFQNSKLESFPNISVLFAFAFVFLRLSVCHNRFELICQLCRNTTTSMLTRNTSSGVILPY